MTISSCTISGNTAYVRVKVPMAPMGKLLTCLSRLTLAQLRPTLWSLQNVRAAETSNFPIAPMGKLLTCLSRLTFAQLLMLWSTTGGMCHRDLAKFPSPPWESHNCSLFAGRWCLCRWWHSVNRELPDLLQHSYISARCFSKFPIAPMGDSRVACCLQGGGVAVYGGTVSIVNSQIYSNTVRYVRFHLQKFPSPSWEHG